MSDLAALPVEVQIPRLSSALDFVGTQWPVKSIGSALYACQSPCTCKLPCPTLLCCAITSTLSARQVLKKVVAKLPPCEAIQLQRASR